MSRSSRISCVVAAMVLGFQVVGASAQEARDGGSATASAARHLPGESPVAVDKECIDADGAQVCWLQFADGTRCVVANNDGAGDSSTALNCHFSTPLERLHRMPKD
jgi:hypothetical protein